MNPTGSSFTPCLLSWGLLHELEELLRGDRVGAPGDIEAAVARQNHVPANVLRADARAAASGDLQRAVLGVERSRDRATPAAGHREGVRGGPHLPEGDALVDACRHRAEVDGPGPGDADDVGIAL